MSMFQFRKICVIKLPKQLDFAPIVIPADSTPGPLFASLLFFFYLTSLPK